jgi:hypothetical protein
LFIVLRLGLQSNSRNTLIYSSFSPRVSNKPRGSRRRTSTRPSSPSASSSSPPPQGSLGGPPPPPVRQGSQRPARKGASFLPHPCFTQYNVALRCSAGVARARSSTSRGATFCVGDVVRIESDEFIPADVVLVSSSELEGLCYIEMSNLDGCVLTCLVVSVAHNGVHAARRISRSHRRPRTRRASPRRSSCSASWATSAASSRITHCTRSKARWTCARRPVARSRYAAHKYLFFAGYGAGAVKVPGA